MSTSFSTSLKSLLPSSYSQIRVHHIVALYGIVRLVSSTSLYRKLADKLLNYASNISEHLIPLVYYGIVPDFLIRAGIRLQLRDHLALLNTSSVDVELEHKLAIVQELRDMPIAIDTEKANAQHYEVPAAFYEKCLGPMKKYSCGYWPTSRKTTTTLEESELHMLSLYCQRAQVQDGMHIVDLGCGWGSLTLYLIEKFPHAKITSISNSHSQRDYILTNAKQRGFNVENINVITVRMS